MLFQIILLKILSNSWQWNGLSQVIIRDLYLKRSWAQVFKRALFFSPVNFHVKCHLNHLKIFSHSWQGNDHSQVELYMAYPVAIGSWLFQVFWLFLGNSLSWMAPKWLVMGILKPRKAEQLVQLYSWINGFLMAWFGLVWVKAVYVVSFVICDLKSFRVLILLGKKKCILGSNALDPKNTFRW